MLQQYCLEILLQPATALHPNQRRRATHLTTRGDFAPQLLHNTLCFKLHPKTSRALQPIPRHRKYLALSVSTFISSPSSPLLPKVLSLS